MSQKANKKSKQNSARTEPNKMITTNVVNTSELLEDVRQILHECRTGNLIPEGRLTT